MIWKRLVQFVSALAVFSIPSLTMAATTSDLVRLTSGTATSRLGRSVIAADLDNDGYEDLVGGAPNNATGFISIVYGGAALPTAATLSSSNSVTITGNGSTDFFGVRLATGDFNGDGYADLAVSATGDTTGGASNSGAIYLLYGGATRFTDSAVASVTNSAKFYSGPGFVFGGAIASGDLNNDGYDDVVVSSVNDATVGGSASIIYGRSTMYSGSTSVNGTGGKFTGEDSGNNFSSGIGVGDVNGDGYDDVFIGAMQRNSNGSASGSAYLFYGQSAQHTTSVSASTVAEWTGEAASDNAGATVTVGDITGDGLADMVVAATGSDAGANNAGAVYVIPGSTTTTTSGTIDLSTVTRYTGINASDAVGSLSTGDMNGDTIRELLIGANALSSSSGGVYILTGDHASGSLSTADTVITATTVENLGIALGSGDLNGDGFAELLIGANSYSSNTGAMYIGAMLTDSDLDGTAGGGLSTTLFTAMTTDCNDSDSTVATNQTYYIDNDADGLGVNSITTSVCSSSAPAGYTDNDDDTNDTIANNGVEIDGDGVDNDEDGTVDEHNTVTDNDAHPYYGTLSPNADATDNITAVEGTSDGAISVTFTDGSIYDYTVYSSDSARNTTVAQYNDTGYALVLHRGAKKAYLVNLYDGSVSDRQNLANTSITDNALKLKDLRGDGKTDAVVITKHKAKVKVYVIKVKASDGTLSMPDSINLENKKIDPGHTKVKSRQILLRSDSGKNLESLDVSSKYQLDLAA